MYTGMKNIYGEYEQYIFFSGQIYYVMLPTIQFNASDDVR